MSETREIHATYSPEDNSLRLYPSERLDDETYQTVKASGFKWAPKQKLFVAKRWTPAREDVCIALAGSIEPEETTLHERAQAKADRLDALSAKRADQAQIYRAAAERISERFAAGQPILMGHHSQRRAEKDRDRMRSASDKAIACFNAVDYWSDRAASVEHHANYKHQPAVRARRIKTLLKELRDHQNQINHGYICLDLWERIQQLDDKEDYKKQVRCFSGATLKTGRSAPDGLYDALNNGELTEAEVVKQSLDYAERLIHSEYNARWIHHILNRLAYERSELGETPRFDGELTPVILQAFAREQGANKPKAHVVDNGFCLSSPVPLPLHVGEGNELTLSCNEWLDLMQGLGHVVNTKPRRKPRRQTVPLLNPSMADAEKLQALWNADQMKCKHGKTAALLTMTQAYYSEWSRGDYSPYKTITLDQRGRRIWDRQRAQREGRSPSCRVRVGHSGELYGGDRIIVITDKPSKPLPLDWAALMETTNSTEGEVA